jgi:N-acetyl-gamma-glutamyl-phosphate reductase
VIAALREGDMVVAGGRDAEAAALVPGLLERGARAIDLSSCFRADAGAVYGLTEWQRAAIAGARLVANPGCYPTAALLALLPLAGIVDAQHVVIDAKSGISGAGRTPRVGSLVDVTFTPHVVPIARGMLVDAYVVCGRRADARAVANAYAKAYAESPFVRLLTGDCVPSVAAVNGTNDAELRVDIDGAMVRVICAIDNLGKGAAGQAVQNLNVMLGHPEEVGFHDRAIVA